MRVMRARVGGSSTKLNLNGVGQFLITSLFANDTVPLADNE